MGVLVVIPARYGSSRFPGKPLAELNGKPMIQHVCEGAAQGEGVDEVVVATDDERIVAAVQRFGGKAMMTSPSARSGTERVAEVARGRDAPVIINVQGDEPLIQPEMVGQLADFLTRHPAVPMASLMTKLTRAEDVTNPNVVKVVVDRDGFALYFSRSPIPFVRDDQARSRLKAQGGGPKAQGRRLKARTVSSQPPASSLEPRASSQNSLQPRAFKHLGLYGYQRHFLLQFPSLEPTPLEQVEQLEQLRALEHGYRIKLLETAHDSIGVDTPEDLARVEAVLKQTAISRQQTATRMR